MIEFTTYSTNKACDHPGWIDGTRGEPCGNVPASWRCTQCGMVISAGEMLIYKKLQSNSECLERALCLKLKHDEMLHLKILLGKDIGWQRKYKTGKDAIALSIYEKIVETLK